MNQLARLVNPDALARHDGARARMRVEAPATWAGDEVMVEVATRLCCAECDGGGCDRCGRSGAVRLGDAPRKVSVRLPAQLGAPGQERGIAVRLFDPFGDASLGELVVEVVVGAEASPALTRIAPPPAPLGASAPAPWTWVVAVGISIALVAALWLLSR